MWPWETVTTVSFNALVYILRHDKLSLFLALISLAILALNFRGAGIFRLSTDKPPQLQLEQRQQIILHYQKISVHLGWKNHDEPTSTSYGSSTRLYNRQNPPAAFRCFRLLAMCLHDRRRRSSRAAHHHDKCMRAQNPKYVMSSADSPQGGIHTYSPHLDHPGQLPYPASI
jgi:hypothetical protein